MYGIGSKVQVFDLDATNFATASPGVASKAEGCIEPCFGLLFDMTQELFDLDRVQKEPFPQVRDLVLGEFGIQLGHLRKSMSGQEYRR